MQGKFFHVQNVTVLIAIRMKSQIQKYSDCNCKVCTKTSKVRKKVFVSVIPRDSGFNSTRCWHM